MIAMMAKEKMMGEEEWKIFEEEQLRKWYEAM